MRIKLFQIDTDKDKNNLLFARYELLEKYQGTKDINSSIYKEVFSGDVDCKSLEDVFAEFNKFQPMLRGHSMAVSDIVKTDDGFFFCDSVGFQKVDFDESKVVKPDNLLRVIYVEPRKRAYVTEMGNTLEAIQRAVMGDYEDLDLDGSTVALCNRDSKNIGMQGNRRYNNGENVIAGPFVIVGVKGGGYTSLIDSKMEKFMNMFGEPEEISEEEVQEDNRTEFRPFQMG